MTISTERSYRHTDRSAWGDGPWRDEPDKVQWIDGATGLDCLIVRNRLGALCGYVGVPPEHPWHGRHYGGDGWDDDTAPDNAVDVHGGLTYADSCDEGAPEDRAICHVPLPGRPADVWWFGFDCAHLGDVTPGLVVGYAPSSMGETYRTVGYVRRECESLARQLVRPARDPA